MAYEDKFAIKIYCFKPKRYCLETIFYFYSAVCKRHKTVLYRLSNYVRLNVSYPLLIMLQQTKIKYQSEHHLSMGLSLF